MLPLPRRQSNGAAPRPDAHCRLAWITSAPGRDWVRSAKISNGFVLAKFDLASFRQKLQEGATRRAAVTCGKIGVSKRTYGLKLRFEQTRNISIFARFGKHLCRPDGKRNKSPGRKGAGIRPRFRGGWRPKAGGWGRVAQSFQESFYDLRSSCCVAKILPHPALRATSPAFRRIAGRRRGRIWNALRHSRESRLTPCKIW